jgi:hypothetical protein
VPYPAGLAFDSAGNLYVGESTTLATSNSITEITPGGTKSTFATGFNTAVFGLTFSSAGNLLVSTLAVGEETENILAFTPGGSESVFATGFDQPRALAFDTTGDLFVANTGDDKIIEVAPDGTQTTFATGVGSFGLAFQPVPEPSIPAILILGTALSGWRLLRKTR